MLFSSMTFLFAFLPAVLLVYYISPVKYRNFVLMIFSMVFYAWGEPKYILVMLASIVVGYTMGLVTGSFIERDKKSYAKLAMIFAVVINLGIMVFFKYIGFFTSNINDLFGTHIKVLDLALPLGISFYTFQILSYSIDVYREKVAPQKNFVKLATYVTLFPQLIAGPIVRYETVEEELTSRKESFDNFGEGVRRFIIGLGKKVLIANMAGEIFEMISCIEIGESSVILSWIGSIAFSIQIFFDFAGYSDMAIGLGRMFGFNFLENFNYPYISKSITEFWNRWHISLSSWFKDYVYIPLGGNRKGKAKTLRNIFIVWILTGFWHGAAWNFIIWGLFYFIALMIEKLFLFDVIKKTSGIISRIYTLFLVNIGWVIFSYDNLSDLKVALSNMFGISDIALTNANTFFYLAEYSVFLILAIILSTPLLSKIGESIKKKNSRVYDALEVVFLIVVLILATSYLASDAFNPFLYFRF